MAKNLTFLVLLACACFGQNHQGTQGQASPQSAAKASPSADQQIQLLREDIRSRRKHLIADNLKLTSDQATKFWPVYDEYTTGDEETALVKEYSNQWGTMTDEQASSLVKRSLAVDEQVAQLRVKYAPIFSKAVPGQVVASFFQLDRFLQAVLDVQLASQIPLVQEQK